MRTYLDELAGLLDEARAAEPEPVGRLAHGVEVYAAFCVRYPAFLDCALSLMRRPAADLREMLSESVWLRLGQGMSRCISYLTDVLHDGAAEGAFAVEDPEYLANVLWTQVLGTMHLARIGVGVRQVVPGVPELFRVDGEHVVQTCVESALATVGVAR